VAAIVVGTWGLGSRFVVVRRWARRMGSRVVSCMSLPWATTLVIGIGFAISAEKPFRRC
jgi:hypothetical protein